MVNICRMARVSIPFRTATSRASGLEIARWWASARDRQTRAWAACSVLERADQPCHPRTSDALAAGAARNVGSAGPGDFGRICARSARVASRQSASSCARHSRAQGMGFPGFGPGNAVEDLERKPLGDRPVLTRQRVPLRILILQPERHHRVRLDAREFPCTNGARPRQPRWVSSWKSSARRCLRARPCRSVYSMRSRRLMRAVTSSGKPRTLWCFL
jgi:hypothetical protein